MQFLIDTHTLLWFVTDDFKLSRNTLRPIDERIQINDFQLLNIEPPHISILSSLPLHHRDPFDRMLIAQNIAEGLPIISADTAFDAYGVTRLW